MAKQQEQKLTFTESYHNQLCKLYSFKEEKARYRKSYIDWDKIKRANNKAIRQKAKYLSKDAQAILAPVIQGLKRGKRVFFNHKYISSITLCKRRQNQNIIKQLESVLDITYHNSITYNGKKHRFSYEFSYKLIKLENTSYSEHPIEQFPAQQNDLLYIYKENNNIEDIDLKSNFLQNSEEVKTAPIETIKFKKRLHNERKKPTNAELKARVYRFNQYTEPKDLKHHYPLIKEDESKLQSLSGRDFTLNAMNEILLDMSKRRDNRFCSKAQFMAYFGKCLRFEMRDAIKTGNDNFRIKANVTPINQKEIEKQKQIEQYLAEVEQQAITHVCPENQLKARLANTLEPLRSYELLSNIKNFSVIGGIVKIYLRTDCNLSEYEKEVVLSQVKSIYSTHEVNIGSVEYLVENTCQQVKGYDEVRTKETPIMPTLQQCVWGDISRQLIEIYGVHIYNNWFSKLVPVIDEQKGTIDLEAPNLFIQQWIETNYGEVIMNIIKKLGLELKELSGSYDLKRG